MKLQQLVPMLKVSDIHRSLQFYQEVAGFERMSPLEALEKWSWAEIKSGDVVLMLAQCCDDAADPATDKADPATDRDEESWPTIFYFYPDDVEALYDHVKGLGCEVDELSTTFYGMQEFSVRDPDGHLLSFGQEVETCSPQAA